MGAIMGMFDYVEYEANCEKCGAALCDFQSKSGPCAMLKLKPTDVDWFYASCDKCGTWHDFKVDRTCVVNSIETGVVKRPLKPLGDF